MPKSTVTFDTVREIGLALPEVVESMAYGSPCLKFRGKILTGLPVHKSAEPGSVGIAIDFDQRAELIAADPETYYVASHYADYPIVLVRMSRIDAGVLRDLLGAAWRFRASNTPASQTPASEAPRPKRAIRKR